jgi:DHA1 family bicyclomycin/chloramphenicol resistance-like MFS transporter
MASSAAMMSTHLYTPSLPHLPDYFNTTPELAKLTLSFNALAFGFSQLIYGPLSDRFGRRPVMLWGMAGFVLFSFSCALAQTIDQLIVARIFQGMSGAAEAVLVYAIIHDLFNKTDRVRALAIYGMVIALTPATAPIIGGYMHVWLGWRANFVLIAVMGLLALLLILRLLPESSVPDKNGMRPKLIFREYRQLLTNREFMNYAIMTGSGSGTIMAFITAGPFILILHLNVRTEHYGLFMLMPVSSYIMSNIITRQIACKINFENLLRLGLLIATIGSFGVIGLIFTDLQKPLSLVLTFSLTTFGLGPVFAIAPMRALDAADSSTGVASAMANTIPMVMGGLASVNLSVFHDGTSRPLAITVLGLLLTAGFAYWVASRRAVRTMNAV